MKPLAALLSRLDEVWASQSGPSWNPSCLSFPRNKVVRAFMGLLGQGVKPSSWGWGGGRRRLEKRASAQRRHSMEHLRISLPPLPHVSPLNLKSLRKIFLLAFLSVLSEISPKR